MHEAWILTKKIYYYKFYLVLGSYHNVFKTFKQKQIQNWPEREGGGGQVKRGVLGRNRIICRGWTEPAPRAIIGDNCKIFLFLHPQALKSRPLSVLVLMGQSELIYRAADTQITLSIHCCTGKGDNHLIQHANCSHEDYLELCHAWISVFHSCPRCE